MKRTIILLGFIFLLTIPIIIPFLKEGYPETHDGLWAVIRQAEMHRELKEGQFPPRWAGYLNHGFGYPLFLFAYPLPFFIGEIFHLIGFGVIDSIKILFILSAIFSGIFMFVFVRKLWGDWAGLLSVTLYLYAPYRMVNMYIRGSIGELLAFGFFPLIFWLYYLLTEKLTLKLEIICAIILCLFILNHNASAFLFFPFFVLYLLYLLYRQAKKDRLLIFKKYCISLIVGAMLSAFFWIPMLLEKQYIALSIYPLTNQLLYFVPWQVLFGLTVHPLTKVPLHIGVIHLFLGLLGFFISIFFIKKDRKFILLLSILFLISVFLSLSNSQFIWKLPLFKDMDFPYRILGICSFFLAIIGGSIVNNTNGKYMVIPLVLIIIFVNVNYIKVNSYNFENNSYFESNDSTTTSNDEFMPIWVNQKPKNRPEQKIISDQGIFKVINNTSNYLNILVTLEKQTILTINTLYFPGWKAYIDDIEVPIIIEPKTGLIQFYVPRGKEMIVQLRFTRTIVRQIADLISISTLILLMFYLCSKKLFRLFS